MSEFFEHNFTPLYPNKTEQLLQDNGLLNYGHTIFENGSHGAGYLSKTEFLNKPALLYEVAQQLIEQFDTLDYDFVVGPVNFGYTLASYCALAVNKPYSYIFLPHNESRYNPLNGRMHRDFIIPPGRKALLVDDWAISGDTVIACLEYLELNNITVSGTGLIGANKQVFRYLQDAGICPLVELPFEHYAESDCLDCQTGRVVEYRGIRE